MTLFGIQALPTIPQPMTWRNAQGVRRWPAWLLCFGGVAAWFGCTAWLRPLALPDEGRYVGVAWEMLRSGDWLVPTLDGLPFFHKPPLFYWITAGAMHVFGPSVVAARAAPWLASVAISTGLFAFLSRWVGRKPAWATVVVLATVPLFYGAAQYANMDMLVAACVSAAILLTAHAAFSRADELRYRYALAGAFVAVALGVLAKGLIGVVLPILVLVVWGASTRRLGKVLTLLTWGPGWLLFSVIAAPWFILMHSRFPDFDHYFFVVQHFQRFTSVKFNNGQPWWFYALALLALALPWSIWLLASIRRRPAVVRNHSDVRALMLVWVGTVVVFFSLPSSKLVGYILPALPPLAFLIADATSPYWSKFQERVSGPSERWTRTVARCLVATPALAAIVCLSATVAAHFYQPKSLESLGEILRGLRRAGEPVIFLGRYFYDVPFYARLDGPVSVVDQWLPSEVADDSWRRELVDAAHLAPTGSAKRLLVPAELGPELCHAPSSWVIGPRVADPGLTWLNGLPPVRTYGSTALWRVESLGPTMRSALRCDKPAV